jgi:hypothetical protein
VVVGLSWILDEVGRMTEKVSLAMGKGRWRGRPNWGVGDDA